MELASSSAAWTDDTIYAVGASLHALAEPPAQQRFALLHPALFSLWREGTSPYEIQRDSLFRSFWDAPSLLVPVINPHCTALVAVWPLKRVLEVYIADVPTPVAQSVAMVRTQWRTPSDADAGYDGTQDVAQFMSAMATTAGFTSDRLPVLSKGWVCRINVRLTTLPIHSGSFYL